MKTLLKELGIKTLNSGVYAGHWINKPDGDTIVSINPYNETEIAAVLSASKKDYEKVVSNSLEVFSKWRMYPAPKRGEIMRQISLEFRKHKKALGTLISLETGKILAEGEGEVQEMIDIADFAVGLSRQLCGFTMHSEREKHRMYEQWHPLGAIGVITAFNFPGAVWAWNAMIAAVCGDTIIWKPSAKVPLTAIAVQNIINPVLEKNGFAGVMNLIIGGGETIGEYLIHDKRIPLISATGSFVMGRRVGSVVGERLGRTILELGGNNAAIIMDDANIDLTVRAVVFGAVGTAGQRCTTTRRLVVQENILEQLTNKIKKAYASIKIGNPLEKGILMGPLIDKQAVDNMMIALEKIKNQGGSIIYGGSRLKNKKGYFVEPALVLAKKEMPILQEETFAPILYLIAFRDIKEAIEVHNNVPQGLSSAMFTKSLINAETFLSHEGSDCGIANINIGTSGAEIGGAFGGEKDTGGGREAGSDAWKAYMRRQTTTINFSNKMPLAQGIKFGD
ncbi:MAG: aldehyde dehydrogenase family protein [Spirochaetia bacterium]|nr:aldehyde dehydrogenase family protein [Spirochaetia bacterium]